MKTIIKVRAGYIYDIGNAERLGEIEEKTESGTGHRETLYRTTVGRLVVSIEEWSPDGLLFALEPVSQGDLDIGGRYEALSRDAGFLG